MHFEGFGGLFANSYVFACAAFSAMGGLLFGYECVQLPSFLEILFSFRAVRESSPSFSSCPRFWIASAESRTPRLELGFGKVS